MMLRFTILAVMLDTRQKINKVYREVFQYIYCASIGSYIVLSFLPVLYMYAVGCISFMHKVHCRFTAKPEKRMIQHNLL